MAFVTSRELNRHMRYHVQKECHECERCGREYADPKELEAHRAKYFAFDKCPERRYRCKFCGERYTDIPLLREHLRRHRSGELNAGADAAAQLTQHASGQQVRFGNVCPSVPVTRESQGCVKGSGHLCEAPSTKIAAYF